MLVHQIVNPGLIRLARYHAKYMQGLGASSMDGHLTMILIIYIEIQFYCG